MNTLWGEITKSTRPVFNPRPPVPKTGWKMLKELPSLAAADALCVDLETYDPDLKTYGPGWGRGVGHIVGVAVGTNDGWKQYFPLRHIDGPNHEVDPFYCWLNDQLGRPHQPKVGHNIIYDLGWLRHEGITVRGEIHDTWTAAKLLDHSSSATLEDLSQRVLKEGKASSELYEWGWLMWGRGKAKSEDDRRAITMQHIAEVPPELVGHYAESDVALPLQLLPHLYAKMQRLGLEEVYRLECDLIPLLVEMRMQGVSVNLDAAERARVEITTAIDALQKQVDDIAGRHVNTGAPTEVGPLFDQLGIKYPLTAKAQKPQLKAEFLKTVEHPVAGMIVELEELKKYRGTFIDGYILGANIDGKIYGSFNPLKAVTGRMSSSQPNLQNIPSRNELAKVIRSIFIPDQGHHHWRKYDYSSIESRILAHFAVGRGAKALRKEYQDNPDTDYHNFTKKLIQDTVGLDLNRKHVKACNFAGIYGASEKKLQQMMGLSDIEAQTFFTAYHDGLPYVKETMNFMSHQANEHGHTRTILGRRAVFDRWEPKFIPYGQPRAAALPLKAAVAMYGPNVNRAYLHKALNYVIQGSAADLMKTAMVKCWKAGVFDAIGVPRLVVHDELDWSVAENSPQTDEAFHEMLSIMENAIPFSIPIKADGEWGPNWGELYPLNP